MNEDHLNHATDPDGFEQQREQEDNSKVDALAIFCAVVIAVGTLTFWVAQG